MAWTQEHMITGTARVEWDLHVNHEAGIEIHIHPAGRGEPERLTLMHPDEPYDPPGYTPEQMDALCAWWLQHRTQAPPPVGGE